MADKAEGCQGCQGDERRLVDQGRQARLYADDDDGLKRRCRRNGQRQGKKKCQGKKAKAEPANARQGKLKKLAVKAEMQGMQGWYEGEGRSQGQGKAGQKTKAKAKKAR